MSVVVTVAAAGSVVVGAKIFAGVTAAAASAMGLRLIDAAQRAEQRNAALQGVTEQGLSEQGTEVEVSVATEAALEKAVAERCSLRFSGEDIDLTVTRDIRGKVTVRAHGRGLSRDQVTARAEELLGRIRQQIAYREVVRKMKLHGFAVKHEAVQEDGTVRVHLKRR